MVSTTVGFVTPDPDPEGDSPSPRPSKTRARYPGASWRADKLRHDMEAAGVRPQMLAEALGVSSQVVSNWRRDGAIAAKYLPAIARIVGRPVEEYLAPPVSDEALSTLRAMANAGAHDPGTARLGGRRFVQIRPFMHAATPGAAAARAALEGARTMLVTVRTDLSAKSFAVETPEGVIGPTGTANGGCVVVDPGRMPQNADVVLTFTDRAGPRLRKFFAMGDMRFTAPLGPNLSNAGAPVQDTGDFRLLGVCCEWHPTPVILSSESPRAEMNKPISG